MLVTRLPMRYCDFWHPTIIKLFSPRWRRNTLPAAATLSLGSRAPQLVEGLLLHLMVAWPEMCDRPLGLFAFLQQALEHDVACDDAIGDDQPLVSIG